MQLIYKTHFNAAYKFQNPNWSEEQNREVFGEQSLSSPEFHGQNYQLEICLLGEVEPLSGSIFDKRKLRVLVKEKIEKRYDHRNLYLDMDDFADTVPTVERLAEKIWQLLRIEIPENLKLKVRIDEREFAAVFEGNL